MNQSQPTTTVLLIDDYEIVRLATKFLLKDLIQPITVLDASSFQAAVGQLRSTSIQLVLLDIGLPDGEGLAMIEKIRRLQPNVLILIFSAFNETIYGLHYIKAGANGYLSKNSTQSEIQGAILTVLSERRYLSQKMQTKILNEAAYGRPMVENPLEALSYRELEIADLLVKGNWVKEIAMLLGVTESSVSTYKSRIFEKLGVNSLIELFEKMRSYKE